MKEFSPTQAPTTNPERTPEPDNTRPGLHLLAVAEGADDGVVQNADLVTMGEHPGVVALAREVDAATQTAVDGLRAFGYSWGEIASRLGTSRQAAVGPVTGSTDHQRATVRATDREEGLRAMC